MNINSSTQNFETIPQEIKYFGDRYGDVDKALNNIQDIFDGESIPYESFVTALYSMGPFEKFKVQSVSGLFFDSKRTDNGEFEQCGVYPIFRMEVDEEANSTKILEVIYKGDSVILINNQDRQGKSAVPLIYPNSISMNESSVCVVESIDLPSCFIQDKAIWFGPSDGRQEPFIYEFPVYQYSGLDMDPPCFDAIDLFRCLYSFAEENPIAVQQLDALFEPFNEALAVNI